MTDPAPFKIAGRRGRALQKLRVRLEIPQCAVAERLGVSQPYLSHLETEHGGYGLPRGFGRRHQEAMLELLRGDGARA